MSMKKFDIEKQLAKKVTGRMQASGIPSRFGPGAVEVLDKRERRTRDAAAGLVPFACKLPGELVKQLHEQAAAHEGGINAVMAELLTQALAVEKKPVKAATKAAAKSPAKLPEKTPEKAPEKAPAKKKAADE
jgi:plasmid stability protein